MVLQIGDTVGNYEVEEALGSGGMAEVYRVTHRLLGTVHALKIVLFDKPGLSERLVREGRVQARLAHPNVVAVSDVVSHEGRLCLVMEYVPGPTLHELLVQEGPLAPDAARGLVLQVLDAVGAAHALGIIHRDIKPENVLMHDGVPKVADFGIARPVESEKLQLTRAGTPMGTPGFMAPEQWADASTADERADVFGIGALLHCCLAGEPPFSGDTALEVLEATLTGRREPLPASVPPSLGGVVDKALATAPDERFQDCAAFSSALQALVLGAPATGAAPLPPVPASLPAVPAAIAEPAAVHPTLVSAPYEESGFPVVPVLLVVAGLGIVMLALGVISVAVVVFLAGGSDAPPTPQASAQWSDQAGLCQPNASDRMGYYFVRNPPRGELFVLPIKTNVRADYPREANGFTRSPEILCALREGATVAVPQAPINAGRRSFWVPLRGSDVILP